MATKLPEAVQRQLEDAERIESEQAAQAASPPEGQPADPPPETPPAPPEPPPPTEDWQHKFQTLQGKYNSETSTLRQQVEELTQKVNELTAKPTTPEPPPAEPPPGYERSDSDPYIMVPTVRACKFRVSKQETGIWCPDTFVTWCEHYNKVVIRAECHGCTVPLEWD